MSCASFWPQATANLSVLLSQALAVVTEAHPEALSLDLLSLHLSLYRQLRSLFDSSADPTIPVGLVRAKLGPALVPGQPCAFLLESSLSAGRTHYLRASEALSAAGRMVDRLPSPPGSTPKDNILLPLWLAAACSRDLSKADLVIVNNWLPHIPPESVPPVLTERLLDQMHILDGANLRGSILANIILLTSGPQDGDSERGTAGLRSVLHLFDTDQSSNTLLNVTRYFLPPLFTGWTSAASSLLKLLEDPSSGDRFPAWVSVASLGVSLGYLDVADLPPHALRQAITHADVSVRIRALQLLVGSKKLLREDIANLVIECLTNNLVIPSAG